MTPLLVDLAATSQPIGGTAGQAATFLRSIRARGSDLLTALTSATTARPRRPRRWRRPIARRVAARPLLEGRVVGTPIPQVLRLVVARSARGAAHRRGAGQQGRGIVIVSRRSRGGRWDRVRGLPSGPFLERRADRERRREAVRLLVG